MKPLLALTLLVILGACTNPGLSAGVGIGPGGVSINPVITANIGGANVSINP